MAQAAAYQRTVRNPASRPQRRPLQEISGKGLDARANQALEPRWQRLFKYGVITVVLAGMIMAAAVWLSAYRMGLDAQIEQSNVAATRQQSAIAEKEQQYLAASNPLNVEKAATDLGMVSGSGAEQLNLR